MKIKLKLKWRGDRKWLFAHIFLSQTKRKKELLLYYYCCLIIQTFFFKTNYFFSISIVGIFSSWLLITFFKKYSFLTILKPGCTNLELRCLNKIVSEQYKSKNICRAGSDFLRNFDQSIIFGSGDQIQIWSIAKRSLIHF